MLKNGERASSIDIFQLIMETAEREKRDRRKKFLEPLGVKEFFFDGIIIINKRICKGLECRLCIKACPTNALYWKNGEIGITEDLCIYCGACVLSCIVDNCIEVKRKRPNGEFERFSKPSEFIVLQYRIGDRKRFERVKAIFPKPESYIEKRCKPRFGIREIKV